MVPAIGERILSARPFLGLAASFRLPNDPPVSRLRSNLVGQIMCLVEASSSSSSYVMLSNISFEGTLQAGLVGLAPLEAKAAPRRFLLRFRIWLAWMSPGTEGGARWIRGRKEALIKNISMRLPFFSMPHTLK